VVYYCVKSEKGLTDSPTVWIGEFLRLLNIGLARCSLDFSLAVFCAAEPPKCGPKGTDSTDPGTAGIHFRRPGGRLVGNKLYVGNIAYEVNRDMLQDAFAQFGTITDVTIIMDRETGRSKGFGFVEMSSDAEAQAAMEAMDGVEMEGRPLRVSEARPREDRGPRGGGGGRSRY